MWRVKHHLTHLTSVLTSSPKSFISVCWGSSKLFSPIFDREKVFNIFCLVVRGKKHLTEFYALLKIGIMSSVTQLGKMSIDEKIIEHFQTELIYISERTFSENNLEEFLYIQAYGQVDFIE